MKLRNTYSNPLFHSTNRHKGSSVFGKTNEHIRLSRSFFGQEKSSGSISKGLGRGGSLRRTGQMLVFIGGQVQEKRDQSRLQLRLIAICLSTSRRCFEKTREKGARMRLLGVTGHGCPLTPPWELEQSI